MQVSFFLHRKLFPCHEANVPIGPGNSVGRTGLLFTIGLAAIVPYLGVRLSLAINGALLIRIGGLSLVIAGLSALPPIRQIADLDPALVFKGK